MKVAVIGSREYFDYEFVKAKLDYLLSNINEPITIVSGGAKGVDSLAHLYSVERGLGDPIIHKPDYDKYPPKVAPIKRNQLIVDDADVMVAFPKGASNGTRSAIKMAVKKGIRIKVIEL